MNYVARVRIAEQNNNIIRIFENLISIILKNIIIGIPMDFFHFCIFISIIIIIINYTMICNKQAKRNT